MRGRPKVYLDEGKLFVFRARGDLRAFLEALNNKSDFLVNLVESSSDFLAWKEQRAREELDTSKGLFD